MSIKLYLCLSFRIFWLYVLVLEYSGFCQATKIVFFFQMLLSLYVLIIEDLNCEARLICFLKTNINFEEHIPFGSEI